MRKLAGLLSFLHKVQMLSDIQKETARRQEIAKLVAPGEVQTGNVHLKDVRCQCGNGVRKMPLDSFPSM